MAWFRRCMWPGCMHVTTLRGAVAADLRQLPRHRPNWGWPMPERLLVADLSIAVQYRRAASSPMHRRPWRPARHCQSCRASSAVRWRCRRHSDPHALQDVQHVAIPMRQSRSFSRKFDAPSSMATPSVGRTASFASGSVSGHARRPARARLCAPPTQRAVARRVVSTDGAGSGTSCGEVSAPVSVS